MSKSKKCKRCCWHGRSVGIYEVYSFVKCCDCGWKGRRYYKYVPIAGHGKYGPTTRVPYKVVADKP